jgi:hypothetical protein
VGKTQLKSNPRFSVQNWMKRRRCPPIVSQPGAGLHRAPAAPVYALAVTAIHEEKSMTAHAHIHTLRWFFWPLGALLRLVFGLVGLVLRFAAFTVGVVFIAVGALISLTIIGAIVGIPLALIGLLLVLKAIFS